MHLEGLAGGDVHVAVSEARMLDGSVGIALSDHADLAGLVCAEQTSGDLDAHHEGVTALALWVQPDPLQSLNLSWHCVEGINALNGVGLDDPLGHLEGVTAQLDHLGLGKLAHIAVGVEEWDLTLFGSTQVQAVGIVSSGVPVCHEHHSFCSMADPIACSLALGQWSCIGQDVNS